MTTTDTEHTTDPAILLLESRLRELRDETERHAQAHSEEVELYVAASAHREHVIASYEAALAKLSEEAA